LEARRLLSSTLTSGTLNIVEGNNADNVQLSISGTNLKVSENGAVKNFVLSAVKLIKVTGLGGNDTITLASNINIRAAIDGGAGDGNDSLDGGAGNDTLLGRSGNDRLFGDVGNDSLNAGIGNDTVDAGAGNDTVIGDEGNDSILGGDGADNINAGKGNDF